VSLKKQKKKKSRETAPYVALFVSRVALFVLLITVRRYALYAARGPGQTRHRRAKRLLRAKRKGIDEARQPRWLFRAFSPKKTKERETVSRLLVVLTAG
jgi:hypothetical protein